MSGNTDTTLTTPRVGVVPAGERLLDDEAHTLPVCDIFSTVQGEGPHCGHRAVFVRLGHCNLACTWCDTPYTWDETRFDIATECPDTPVLEVARSVFEAAGGPGLVVLTGGEPLMHQRRPGFLTLLAMLDSAGSVVHVETNGTIPPTPVAVSSVGLFVVSPKLANNGADSVKRRIRPAALGAFAALARQGRAGFKFVCTDVADLEEIAEVVHRFDIPGSAVWVMPEGTDADTLLERHRQLVDPAAARGWNTTTRLHVLLWGDARGR